MNLRSHDKHSVTSSGSLTIQQAQILDRVLVGTLSSDRMTYSINGTSYNVADGIIRFRDDSGYSGSFAKQWKQFQLNQYDRHNGTTLYRDRYLKETGWPASGLDGELILEAGCGAGAFTCHLVATGADLVSFDYSTAVDVSKEHNANDRTLFAQADLLDMPFSDNCFDRIFCHGVLQHTPNPNAGFRELNRCLRPGGHISFDVYLKDRRIETWKAKYLWRWMTTRMNQDSLMRFLEWFLPKWLPFDTLIKRVPIFGRYFGSLIPCMNYFWTDLSRAEKVQWAIMNTFDALAPRYDFPVRVNEVEEWFKQAGYSNFEIHRGGNGVVGNGVKP